jgi:hypothetical protein
MGLGLVTRCALSQVSDKRSTSALGPCPVASRKHSAGQGDRCEQCSRGVELMFGGSGWTPRMLFVE